MDENDREFVQRLLNNMPVGYREMFGCPTRVQLNLLRSDYVRVLKMAMVSEELEAEVSRLQKRIAELEELAESQARKLVKFQALAVRRRLQVSRLQQALTARDFELDVLAKENGRLAEMMAKGVYIESATLQPESYNIRTRGTGAMLLAEKLVLFFRASGGENFVTSTIEMEFTDPKEHERYALTIQKLGGEDSPAQKIDRQVKRIAELTAMLSDVVALIEESQGVEGYHLNGDIATWDEVLPGLVDEYVALVPEEAEHGQG